MGSGRSGWLAGNPWNCLRCCLQRACSCLYCPSLPPQPLPPLTISSLSHFSAMRCRHMEVSMRAALPRPSSRHSTSCAPCGCGAADWVGQRPCSSGACTRSAKHPRRRLQQAAATNIPCQPSSAQPPAQAAPCHSPHSPTQPPHLRLHHERHPPDVGHIMHRQHLVRRHVAEGGLRGEGTAMHVLLTNPAGVVAVPAAAAAACQARLRSRGNPPTRPTPGLQQQPTAGCHQHPRPPSRPVGHAPACCAHCPAAARWSGRPAGRG